MGLASRGNVLWLSMVLAGVVLGIAVWLSLPEQGATSVPLPDVAPAPELAVVEPGPPHPFPEEGGEVESAEELGAEPLPGFGLVSEPLPPASGAG